jgi:hypothetical protein
LKLGAPVSRARAMFKAARSSGKPTRLLRSASLMNSSISLPTWRDMPRTTSPIASASSMVPSLSNATGLRKAWISPMSSAASSPSSRATVSVSIEWPKRYTKTAPTGRCRATGSE